MKQPDPIVNKKGCLNPTWKEVMFATAGFQIAALASTRLDMCQTPQQTAEMNPFHWKEMSVLHDDVLYLGFV